MIEIPGFVFDGRRYYKVPKGQAHPDIVSRASQHKHHLRTEQAMASNTECIRYNSPIEAEEADIDEPECSKQARPLSSHDVLRKNALLTKRLGPASSKRLPLLAYSLVNWGQGPKFRHKHASVPFIVASASFPDGSSLVSDGKYVVHQSRDTLLTEFKTRECIDISCGRKSAALIGPYASPHYPTRHPRSYLHIVESNGAEIEPISPYIFDAEFSFVKHVKEGHDDDVDSFYSDESDTSDDTLVFGGGDTMYTLCRNIVRPYHVCRASILDGDARYSRVYLALRSGIIRMYENDHDGPIFYDIGESVCMVTALENGFVCATVGGQLLVFDHRLHKVPCAYLQGFFNNGQTRILCDVYDDLLVVADAAPSLKLYYLATHQLLCTTVIDEYPLSLRFLDHSCFPTLHVIYRDHQDTYECRRENCLNKTSTLSHGIF